jgi:hypothetical protein
MGRDVRELTDREALDALHSAAYQPEPEGFGPNSRHGARRETMRNEIES